MRIKNENITIEPFTIEYTKERVEWEEKQCKKYKKMHHHKDGAPNKTVKITYCEYIHGVLYYTCTNE